MLRHSGMLMIPAVLASIITSCSEQLELTGGNYIDSTRIEIRPTVGRQDLELTETRSVGPFDKWSDNPTLWLNADFYTFALQTKNHLGGEVDYRKTSDVMDNQLMHILDKNGKIAFYDRKGGVDSQVHRYYSFWRNRRYKFFTYFTDDATVGPLVRTQDSIKAEITINGRQDLMHGFAYHTDADLDALRNSMDDSNETRIFTDESAGKGKEYLYSALAANRGVHPQFHLKHLLSRFDIYVEGVVNDRAEDDEKDRYSFMQCFIDTLTITSRNHGSIVIASDNWDDEESYNNAYETRQLVEWDRTRHNYLPTIFDNRALNGDNPLPKVDFERLWQEMVDSSLVDISNVHYHQVTSTKPAQLCESILLPAVNDSLELKMAYKYMFYNYSSEFGRWKVDIERTRNNGDFGDRNAHRIALPDGAPFMPGRKYSIRIRIYGPLQVSVDVINGDSWKPGGQEDLNTDDMDIIIR